MKTTFASFGLSAVMSASTLALTLAASTGVAHAQVTSSSVVGSVVDSNGNGISNASVSLVNETTGLARNVSTEGNGNFSIRNLPVNGSYAVTVTAGGFQGERVEGIRLSLGDNTQLSFQLGGEAVSGDEIVVVGQRQVLSEVAVGPSASFGIETLENAPAINRNIADVIRIDPRISVDESRGGVNAIQCAGQNSRFNSFTLDGVQLNDAFGLNANGFPTERQPFPFDALEQVTVELAPLDVIYGNFTACNINSVTKSGTNEIHGSAFIDYTDDGLIGDSASGQDFDFGNFDEIRYGLSVGGPIIKDKLFFYVAYEKLEGANTYPNTSVTLNGGISQAEIDEIGQISRDVYQYDPGFIPTSFPNEDEKILVKLDWNINEKHRAAGTFQWNDGFNIVRSDGDTDELEFSNHLYERGAELFSYTGAFFSDWTDNFSTELRGSYTEIDNRQNSLGGTEFGEIRVETDRVDVYLGSDDSRQANDLNYDVLDLIFRANYSMGDHNFTFGAETQQLEIFNLFIQQAQTEIRFDSIENFRNGIASQVEFNNAPSLNPNDAAAEWGYNRNALYLQDEWNISDALTLVAGLRYDWYTSDDVPTENPDFVADYGFSNSQNFDGVDLWQPRIGFTYDATDVLQFHGGVGKYSGGNPNVWLSNNYSANNVTQVGARIRGDIDLFALDYALAEDGVPNAPGYAVPQELVDSVASGVGRNFEINYLDPDFEIPSEWKYTLGATWNPFFGSGGGVLDGEWFFQADLLWSQAVDTAIIQRGDLVEVGTQVIDGVTYPVYESPLLDSFELTNADVNNRGFVASIGAAKDWENGFSARVGYAYSDAEDVTPMTSAVAFSNYNNRAFIDPQEQIRAVSNFNTKHRLTASASYEKAFFGDFNTRFDTFFLHQSGQPYSIVQDGQEQAIYGFTPFLSSDRVLEAGTERNEFRAPSWTKIDLKITQDLPGFRGEDRAQVFVVVDNLGNLIDSDWGTLEQANFPNTRVRFDSGELQDLSINAASTYEIRFGAKYDF